MAETPTLEKVAEDLARLQRVVVTLTDRVELLERPRGKRAPMPGDADGDGPRVTPLQADNATIIESWLNARPGLTDTIDGIMRYAGITVGGTKLRYIHDLAGRLDGTMWRHDHAEPKFRGDKSYGRCTLTLMAPAATAADPLPLDEEGD